MHIYRTIGYFAITCAGLTISASTARSSDKPTPIPQLTFRSDAGKLLAWKDLAGDRGTAVVFLSFDCPMSTNYCKPLSDLATSYSRQGVKFIGVCPCDDEPAVIAKKAKEYQLSFPIFKDMQLAAAEAFNATITPQVFVLNSRNQIVYAGLIDDGYSKRLVRSKEVTRQYLKEAIDHVLAPKRAVPASTKAIGCAIVRDLKRGTSTEVTYTRDVMPILQNHCQGCHRPGEIGPFSLMNYRQAVNWADDIKDFAQTRKMPPWKATGGKEFVGDRRLSEKEIQTIAKWVDNGCPRGDTQAAQPERRFPEGWQLGKPDLILTTDRDFVLGPTGNDVFRVFVMPTHLTEDKFVVAVEVRPGNSKIVHHTLNYFDATGTARKLEEEAQAKLRAHPPGPDAVDIGPGFSSSMGLGFRPTAKQLLSGKQPVGALGGWAPGVMAKFLPEGTGYLLPAGSDFVMQMHFHRNGKLERDRTQVGLYFAKKPIDKPMLGLVTMGVFKTDKKIEGRFGRLGYIPAGDSHFVARGSTVALEDCTLYTVLPHMHLLGKSVKITLTPPGESTETLIDVSDWDYNWQEQYQLKKPIKIKAGTRFDIEAIYDNSSSNPNNPNNPPIDVRFGEQTTDEMLFGFLGATKDTKTGLPFIIMQRRGTGAQKR